MEKYAIGINIRKLRRQKHLRQKELAKLSGISGSYLSDIENNRTIPSLKTLFKICYVLEVELTLLLSTFE